MRNYAEETEKRIAFIQTCLKESNADGIIYGNSGGKDSALCGILCRMACENTVGIIMPCGSKRNYEEDKRDAYTIAEHFSITTRYVDLAQSREALYHSISNSCTVKESALHNIAPRLRMNVLYTIAASENRLVAGSGNRSEAYMGYFTKYGDGAYDFNPIGDLTVTEIYEFLHYLNAPDFLFHKPCSAGLYDNQSDEQEMGITYKELDQMLLTKTSPMNPDSKEKIKRYHQKSEHKRHMPKTYGGDLHHEHE